MQRPSREGGSLVRSLNSLDIAMLGIAGTVGGSVYLLIGITSGLTGPGIIFAFLINAAITLITAMSYAELGSAFPDTGGGYLWVKEALPRPNPFVSGWLAWFAHSVAGSLYALSFGFFLSSLLGISQWNFAIPFEKLIAVLAIAGFTVLNIKGAAETGRTGSIITLSQILLLGGIIGAGAISVYRNPAWPSSFSNYLPNGIFGLLAAMSVSFIAFEGYEIIAQTAEEVKNPRKNIPRAIFITLGTVTSIYVLLAFAVLAGTPTSVTGGMPTWQWLGNLGENGVLEAARSFMPLGAIVVLSGGIISSLSALNATTYSSSRLAYAMGRTFNLPFIFSRLSRFRTPHVAIIASAAIMTGMLLLTVEQVAVASGIMFILLFAQVNIAAIIIRRNFGEKLDYGFKTPFFPLIPVMGIFLKIGLALFIAFYQPLPFAIAMIWLLLGYVFYEVYVIRSEVRHLAPPIFQEGTIEKMGKSALVVVGGDFPQELAGVGIAIAQQKSSGIDFLKVVTVPRRMPLSAGVLADEDKRTLEFLGSSCREKRIPFRSYTKVTHDIVDAILLTIHERRTLTVILPLQYLLSMKKLLVLAPCDVVGSRVDRPLPAMGRIAVAYDLGRHSLQTIDIAYALCKATNSTLYVVHVNAAEARSEEEIRKEISQNLETIGVQDYRLLIAEGSIDPVPKIIETVESIRPDLLVVGAGNPREQVFSRKTYGIIKLTNFNLVVVKGFDVPILGTMALLKQKISRSFKMTKL